MIAEIDRKDPKRDVFPSNKRPVIKMICAEDSEYFDRMLLLNSRIDVNCQPFADSVSSFRQ